MTHRERMLATIRHEQTDRISVDAICIENGDAVAAYLGIPAETLLDRLGLDGRLLCPGYQGALPVDAGGRLLSEWGTPLDDSYGMARCSPLRDVTTIAEVEHYRWPDPLAYDYPQVAVQAAALGGAYALRGPYWKPLFCQVCDLFGMEEAMARMLSEPAIFEATLDAVFSYTLAFCTAFLDACGEHLPILSLGDDFASQRGLIIAPEQWRRFLKPRYAQLFALGKARGKFVWFHSCGDITAVLPDLIDIGMDVWETVQLHTLPISPATLKQEYGQHLTFFGGISTQRLPFATAEEVRRETLACIAALGRDGGYICGPDHHIKPDVPPENVVALFDTATEYASRSRR